MFFFYDEDHGEAGVMDHAGDGAVRGLKRDFWGGHLSLKDLGHLVSKEPSWDANRSGWKPRMPLMEPANRVASMTALARAARPLAFMGSNLKGYGFEYGR